MTLDQLVDAFVEKANASGREAALRVGRQNGDDWIARLEARLPAPLPPSFRSLVARYVYSEFAAGGLWCFANTGEQTEQEWGTALWKDKVLSGGLLREGYIQFARPDTGSYDPICFDTQHRAKDGECPVVWIDHEGILCDDKIVVYKEIAPSFVDIVRSCLK